MPAKIDITGKRFGRLLVTGDAARKAGRRQVACLCDCGKSIVTDPRFLSVGHTKSCGCLQREAVAASSSARAKHRGTESAEYLSWIHMKGRCMNPRNAKFKDYGARGIKVCLEWVNDFARFFSDMGPKPSPSFSLDRIDVDGDYTPANCRWADIKTQARNKRHHRIVELDGAHMPLSEACERTGVNYRSALHRLNTGKAWQPLPAPPAQRGEV